MIQNSLYCLYVVVLLLSSGKIVERSLYWTGVLSRQHVETQGVIRNFCDSFLLGLVFLTSIVSATSLFHPITGNVQIVFSLLILIFGSPFLFLDYKATRKEFVPSHLFFCILLLLFFLVWAVIVASGPVLTYDTGTYHVQTVRWLKEYGVVAGLGNLFGQLGYNSAWHILCSFLDHGPFDQGKSYHVTGLLVFVFHIVFCLEGYENKTGRDNSTINLLRLLGFVSITIYYRSFIASMGTDYVVAVLIHYALVRASEAVEKESCNGMPNYLFEHRRILLFVTAITVFSVTIKLSVLPCLLFPFVIWFRHRKNSGHLILHCLAISAVIGLPFLWRNYFLTGYLLYPQTQIDFFHCDWKVPIKDVQLMVYYIKEFGIAGSGLGLDLGDIAIRDRLLIWFHYWEGSMFVQWFMLIASVAIGSASCFFILMSCLIGYIRTSFWHWWIFASILVGASFCVVTAPEPRFLGAWGLALGYFPLASTMGSFVNKFDRNKTIYPLGVMFTLLAFWFYLGTPLFFKWMNIIRLNAQHVSGKTSSTNDLDFSGTRVEKIKAGAKSIIKSGKLMGFIWGVSPLPIIILKEERSVNGIMVNIPVHGNKLWNSPLPAAQRLHPWLQMRGASLKDGFRVTQDTGWNCYHPKHTHKNK